MEESRTYIDYVARGAEVTGVLTLVVGMLVALVKFVFKQQDKSVQAYRLLRQELGRAILLGLEILVAGDIISTVVTEPNLEQVLILGLIVLIRTFLSLSIEVEIEGRLPWKHSRESKTSRTD